MEEDHLSVQSNSDPGRSNRSWFFAILSALYCLIVVILFTVSQISMGSTIWPFPGLYFLEIILLGTLAWISVWKNSTAERHAWTGLPWIGAGGLLTFVILGAWTIGFYLIPSMALSIGVGVIEDRRKKDNLPLHIILFIAAAFVQALLILLVLSVNVS